MKTGIELISDERFRQIAVKGYNDAHDKNESAGQLAVAAGMYIANVLNLAAKNHTHYDGMGNKFRFQIREIGCRKWTEQWPWSDKDGRLKADQLTSLVKAGALIAAQIDRLNHHK